ILRPFLLSDTFTTFIIDIGDIHIHLYQPGNTSCQPNIGVWRTFPPVPDLPRVTGSAQTPAFIDGMLPHPGTSLALAGTGAILEHVKQREHFPTTGSVFQRPFKI